MQDVTWVSLRRGSWTCGSSCDPGLTQGTNREVLAPPKGESYLI